MQHIVIIGNGISGVSTALSYRARNQNDRITIVSKESREFYSRPALMYLFMGHMKYEQVVPYSESFWKEQNIERVYDTVQSIDVESRALCLESGGLMPYTALVLATGSQPNFFGWPGQESQGVQGFYSLDDLETIDARSHAVKHAVIVGGGLIGVEVAEMYRSRGVAVTFLVRESSFWKDVLPEEEGTLVQQEILAHHVDLRLNTELSEIIADSSGAVSEVVTLSGERIPCQSVIITVGVHPNIEWLQQSGIACDRGIIIDHQFHTNCEGVYAVGDCAQFEKPYAGRRAIEQVWYTGKIQGETLGAVLNGEPVEYQPGVWFNSAKFFDLEYQTYGMVTAQKPDNEESFFWQDSTARRAIRIQFEKASGAVRGLSFFGIRARHDICEKWLIEEQPLEYVIQHCGALNFDPEFYRRFEKALVNYYNQGEGTLKLKTPKGLLTPLWKKILKKRLGVA